MRLSLFKPKVPPPIVLEEKEVRTLAARQIEKMDFTPPEFRDWRESIARMSKIREALFCALKEKPDHSPEFLPSWALWLEMGAAIKTLGRINSDHLNCAVLWDTKTGFPSLPSMTADARKYGETLKNGHRPVALIFDSFCAWTPVFNGRVECCCGRPGFASFRTIEYETVINHGLLTENGDVLIAQLVGIRHEDIGHLKTHFSRLVSTEDTSRNFYNPSKVLKNTNIVWSARNRLKLSGETITISEPLVEAAEEFDSANFCDVFMEIIRSVPVDLVGSTERRSAC